MFDRTRALDLIETAMDTDPYCPVCSAPTTVSDQDGHIVLECSSASEPAGLTARIGALLLPHLRHEIVDLSEGVAA
jgi:hypothetical protein